MQLLVNIASFGLVVFIMSLGAVLLLRGRAAPVDGANSPLSGRWTFRVHDLFSIARIPLAAWMVGLFFLPGMHSNPVWTYSIHLCFVIICLFDVVHDQLAGRYADTTTITGKYLDPAADRFVTLCLALPSFLYGELRWWVFAIVVLSEGVVLLQRYRMKRKRREIRASWLDKLKTGVQYSALYLLLLRTDMLPQCGIGLDQVARALPASFVLWWMTFLSFYTVISVFPYFRSFFYVNDYQLSQREDSNRPWYIVMIPNCFTMSNYLCGVTAVFFAMPEVEVEYRPFVVLFWVMAAALSDAIDGPLARKFKAHSEFGACLDASTDLSTFGLATGVAIFLQFSAIRGQPSLWGLAIAIFYFVFVHWRLARFSILAKQGKPDEKGDFVGLPSPSGALGVLLFFTFFQNLWVMSGLIVLMSLLMYSGFNFISHSNSTRHPFYRYFLIPTTFLGFLLLAVLIFCQPFVSAHTSRELIVYFKTCSVVLCFSLSTYIIHAFIRGPVETVAELEESVQE